MMEYGEEEFSGSITGMASRVFPLFFHFKCIYPDASVFPADTPAILFSRQNTVGEEHVNYFSVPSYNSSIKNRAIVIHEGSDGGKGSWKCSKHSGSKCFHIGRGRVGLNTFIKRDPDGPALPEEEDELRDEDEGKPPQLYAAWMY